MESLKYFCLLALLFTVTGAGAQSIGTDYLLQRDSLIKLSCQPQEKARVELSIEQLEALDPLSFSLNRDRYYRDLAWGYYRRFMHSQDTADARLSLQTYGQVADKSAERWNRLFLHSLLNECAEAKALLEEHLQNTSPEFHPAANQIKHVKKRCPDL